MAKKTESPLISVQREIGLRGTLRDFIPLAWPIVEPSTPYVDGWHQGAICEHLEAIDAGQLQWLVISIPPGCMKSRITGLCWPVWSWIRDPSTRWGYFSYDGDLTLKQARDSLDIYQSDWFQERWGKTVPLAEKDPAAGNYWTVAGGQRFASSVEGKATGQHFHRQVCDDLLKPKALSKVTLAGAKDFLSGTLATRWAHPTKRARVIVAQRLHDDDPSGHAEREWGYTVLRLPMRYESKFPCVTSIGFKDPRVADGELLFPGLHPEPVVTQLERELGPQQTAAQLQQRPVPAGGNIFQIEWFKTWVEAGQDTAHLAPGRWTGKPARFDLMWQSWDCTFKDTKTSDYVVGQVWGRKGGEFFLLWRLRQRMTFTATQEAIRACSRLFPLARTKLIEDKANGSAIIETLKRELTGITPVEPEGGKEARASAVAPMHAAGNVYYPDERIPGNEWVTQHKAEMSSFPFGANDDSVDAESQALNWGSKGWKKFTAAMEKMAGNGAGAAQMRDILTKLGR